MKRRLLSFITLNTSLYYNHSRKLHGLIFFTISELTESNTLNKLSLFVSSLVYNTATPHRKYWLKSLSREAFHFTTSCDILEDVYLASLTSKSPSSGRSVQWTAFWILSFPKTALRVPGRRWRANACWTQANQKTFVNHSVHLYQECKRTL